jgi:hypothetical protein
MAFGGKSLVDFVRFFNDLKYLGSSINDVSGVIRNGPRHLLHSWSWATNTALNDVKNNFQQNSGRLCPESLRGCPDPPG